MDKIFNFDSEKKFLVIRWRRSSIGLNAELVIVSLTALCPYFVLYVVVSLGKTVNANFLIAILSGEEN